MSQSLIKDKRLPTHQMLSDTLRLFNSHSRDPMDHFKLVHTQSAREIRLCSSHPRFIKCTVDGTWINVRGSGPESLHLRFSSCSLLALHSLLAVLQAHRYSGDELIDWELDDWVGAGNPCRLRGSTAVGLNARRDLGFSDPDMWCVDLFPNIEARVG